MPSNLPQPGSLSGEQFLLAIRDAGKRSIEATNEATGEVYQRPIFDPTFEREDTIRAIAGYTGYDPFGNFGAQDLAARTKAELERRPVSPKEYKRCQVAPSIAGYVAGMPNETKKKIDNLIARERLAVDTRLQFEKVANDKSKPIADRQIAKTLAEVETERLSKIREELSEIVR
jgi:hypothetical protein